MATVGQDFADDWSWLEGRGVDTTDLKAGGQGARPIGYELLQGSNQPAELISHLIEDERQGRKLVRSQEPGL